MNYYDTIAAVSTPRGKGGVALIRISGPDALSVGDAVFTKKLSLTESNRAVHGGILLPQADGDSRCIDDGIATVFRAPNSFTGEDTVEICCHGGILVTRTVLAACFAAGARQATAGEFTRRAYVNGKTGLDGAEALSALLEARTFDQLVLARSGMGGVLAEETDRLYDSLLTVVAELRADLDFPDEDVSSMTPAELRRRISDIYEKTVKLSNTYKTGKAVAEGIETVICGRTNSGKSSLYNRLLGRDAAIVTDIEGTTRDIISDTVSLGGVTLRLSDTAGLRDSDDPVEKIGIDRALEAVKRAGLVFVVIDGAREPETADYEYIEKIKAAAAFAVAVINKSDLPQSENAFNLAGKFDRVVTVSAKSGDNIDALAKTVSDAFLDDKLDLDRDAVVSTERQYGSLTTAAGHLSSALAAFDSGIPADLVCSDIECAVGALAEVGGREASEDIIDGIFTKFCVGK